VHLEVGKPLPVPRVDIAGRDRCQEACREIGKAIKEVEAPVTESVTHNLYIHCILIAPSRHLHRHGGLSNELLVSSWEPKDDDMKGT